LNLADAPTAVNLERLNERSPGPFQCGDHGRDLRAKHGGCGAFWPEQPEAMARVLGGTSDHRCRDWHALRRIKVPEPVEALLSAFRGASEPASARQTRRRLHQQSHGPSRYKATLGALAEKWDKLNTVLPLAADRCPVPPSARTLAASQHLR
jgi:hypothetical protein